MTIVYYITGHGFGHATRSLTIIEALAAQQPDCRMVIRSSAPPSFLTSSVSTAVEVQSVATDTGMVQIDSLQLDIRETARQAAAFYETFGARVDAEAAALRALDAAVVVGDIPPLAFAAADAAGVPSVAVANFTWDWIYEAYPEFASEAPQVIPCIRAAYARTSLTLRMPFAGGFDAMPPPRHDIPLVARRSRRERATVRALLGLPGDRPVALASFGGHGADMPYAAIAESDELTIVLTERETATAVNSHRLRRFSIAQLAGLGLRYEDLVAAADVVVSKPGYGIVSECIANGTALLYTDRGHFVEQEVLVHGMRRVLRCREIAVDDLRAGRWAAAIRGVSAQPLPAEQMPADGAETAAALILAAAQSRR